MSVSMSNVVSVQAIVKKDFTKAVKHSSCDCWNLVAATSSKVIAIRNKLDKLTNCLFVCLFVFLTVYNPSMKSSGKSTNY